jgi:hypothetical protein
MTKPRNNIETGDIGCGMSRNLLDLATKEAMQRTVSVASQRTAKHCEALCRRFSKGLGKQGDVVFAHKLTRRQHAEHDFQHAHFL